MRHIRLICFETPYIALSWRDSRTFLPFIKWLFISFVFAFVCMAPFYAQWALQVCGILTPPLFLMSLLGLLSFASVLLTPKNRRFSVGFFIGVLWFYWIGLGLRYFDMSFLIPLVTILVGLVVGVIFYVGLWCECLLWRLIFLLLLSYVKPLGFDWIVLESVFAYSYMGVDKLSVAFIIVGLWLICKYERWWRLLGVACLIFAIDFGAFKHKDTDSITTPPLRIKLIQSDVKQDFAWRMQGMGSIFDKHISHIRQAIGEGYDVVVLPESSFYAPLDRIYTQDSTYFALLRELSRHIAIVTGALRVEMGEEGMLYFNTTYKFENTEVAFYDKVLLVPFGEYLPAFLLPVVNIFFEGIGGFSAGKDFGYFDIKGVRFKNAICYEGTNKGFYADYPQYVIVTSNNAWFVPSLEPILQQNLMKYYARLYGSVIFHATNLSPQALITP